MNRLRIALLLGIIGLCCIIGVTFLEVARIDNQPPEMTVQERIMEMQLTEVWNK